MEDDGNFVSSTEAREYINASIQSFWDLLIGEDSGSLFAKLATTLPQVGTNRYTLPSDFYRLIDVSVKSSTRYYRATQADPQEYAQLLSRTDNNETYSRYFLRWDVENDRFELDLFPGSAPSQLQVRYIPQAPILSLDSDTLNLPDSWCEWIMWDVAIRMLMKEESDISFQEATKARLEVRILDAINEINKTGIKKIRDVVDWEESKYGRLPEVS